MILVLGGTGFVGKNLCVSLHARGIPLRVVSRAPDTGFLDANVPGASALRLEQFMADPKSALFGVETVVYLASTSTPGSNLDSSWREAHDTVEPAMRVMAAVAHHSQANVIYLSSGGAVYGETTSEMISENTELNPISPYGLGKKMTEAAIDFMARTEGLKVTILRPSNPIGRWQVSVSQGVVGALMRAARQGSVFPMIGQGVAVRDYFDVRDLSAAIEAVIDQPDKSHGKIWNVGSGTGTSVREILDLVQEISGRSIAVQHLPSRPTDVARVVLDTREINAALGWAPQHDLRSSLQDLWAAS
ncbi:NAD-dependent epimerase/dehydratase family protein [Meridianimarinicoccus sp. MJW13]|uniref:NAD-dependent epimerase/dehydratase family protein n=1 Tax=Meridianimarinicoccus sp. MJW13 TaxID=2720031 RepID=UPI001865C3BA|nr:NAD-dependent epimerase/dehydratase family protein [Fluviibacterium sp. MJW13]